MTLENFGCSALNCLMKNSKVVMAISFRQHRSFRARKPMAAGPEHVLHSKVCHAGEEDTGACQGGQAAGEVPFDAGGGVRPRGDGAHSPRKAWSAISRTGHCH